MRLVLHSNEHGYDDYDVFGLPLVKRAYPYPNINVGDRFNVYAGSDGECKFGVVWKGDLEGSLQSFFDTDEVFAQIRSETTHGSSGKHDWATGVPIEDGILVFVDDRPVRYLPTLDMAQKYAFELIERLNLVGDKRLNDYPQGYLPPLLPEATASTAQAAARPRPR